MSATSAIDVRLVRPEEAPDLVALLRRCYGETYIDPSFYDEAHVTGLLASGKLSSIGAFTEEDALAGHMGITLRAHGGNTADAGMTLVDPAFRGRGIAKRVAIGLAQQSVALNLVGVHDYPVTVHAATQRIGSGFGIDTGLMLANMPSDVIFEGIDTAAGVRTSSLIRWLPFGPAPRRDVFLPERVRAHVEATYARARLARTPTRPISHLEEAHTHLDSAYDERRQTLRLTVLRAGHDLPRRVEAETSAAEKRGGLVFHVDLSLVHPSTPVAFESLRALGFFFAGVLPEYRDGDALRMQRLPKQLEHASGVLSEEARLVEAFVLGEQRLTPSAEAAR